MGEGVVVTGSEPGGKLGKGALAAPCPGKGGNAGPGAGARPPGTGSAPSG